MGWADVLGTAFGLAMDALAVSIAASLVLPEVTRRHIFRLAFHFGLFQFMMPVLGWLAGRSVDRYISQYDHWAAFALLAFIGGRMLHSAWRHEPDAPRNDPTRGWLLVGLSVATSIDALAVGLGLAFVDVPIWSPSIVIGIVAGILTMLGIHFGSRIGQRFGRLAEAVGGVCLMAIGLRILLSHAA